METVGRYILNRRLATGGMAEIFLAKLVGAAGFEKEVVLKRILPQWSQNRDFVAMLIDEAKIAVRLDHPNIVQVHELARDGAVHYIAMEYVRGWDLRRVLKATAARKSAIPADVAVFLFCEVLEGLAYAHRFKVVHRDISPQNILISEEGAVKITDFGIARAASRSHETATGVLKGKFAYMSPEQATPEDKRKVDGRSDLFSAAVVLYEALTGERLFYRGSDLETLDRVRRAEWSPSTRALELIPPALLRVLSKALQRDPQDRFATAADFRDALRGYAREAGWELSRDRLVSFLGRIFAEPGALGGPEGEETRLLTGGTGLPGDRTQTMGGETLVDGPGSRTVSDHSPERRGRPVAALILGSIALYLVIGLWLRMTRQDPPAPAAVPETQEAVAPPGAAPTAAVPPGTTPAEPPDSISDFEMAPVIALPKKEEPAKGYLSVRAIPWGTVTVDGGRGREAPVRRLALKPGRHTVRVAYEPDGSSVAASVQVLSGKEIVCVAKFRGGKELKCGP
jgi:serine/threonine-protein kinase